MIFISGIGDSKKKLNYRQEWICKTCHRQGVLEIWMTYRYFSIFFIPIIKWNKEYYAESTCCNTIYSIDKDVIRNLKKGLINSIPEEELKRENSYMYEKTCQSCGFVAPSDFDFCPKCGRRL